MNLIRWLHHSTHDSYPNGYITHPDGYITHCTDIPQDGHTTHQMTLTQMVTSLINYSINLTQMVPSLVTWISHRWFYHLSHESHTDDSITCHMNLTKMVVANSPEEVGELTPIEEDRPDEQFSLRIIKVKVLQEFLLGPAARQLPLICMPTGQHNTALLITKALHKLSNWAPFEKDGLWVKTLILKGTFCAGYIAFKPVSESM